MQAMRELLGPDRPLMVDANMRWSADQAIRAARAFAEHDVYWLEEPTIPDDGAGPTVRIRARRRLAGRGRREPAQPLDQFQALIAAGADALPCSP